MKDGQGMEDQEERIKNKKYRSLKMFPSDIILKFKNIVKFKIIKVKLSVPFVNWVNSFNQTYFFGGLPT